MITRVDLSRSTTAHGSLPEASTRTLRIMLVYPAYSPPGSAPTPNAPVYPWAGPFPLVVLSHGLGGSAEGLLPMAQVWAASGYLVALPTFPLTNVATPGGPDGQDVQNQPADVSFIIDQLLAESAAAGRLLSNAIDADKIAVSGHSNGGITTYGLVANSCCKDSRIKAAIVLSGVVSPSFGAGEYDLSDTPPMLVVHGINDSLLAYNQTVIDYNALEPPKGLLRLETADHVSYLQPDDLAFGLVAETSVNFLDGILKADNTALPQLPDLQMPGISSLHLALDEATNTLAELLPEPETNRQASLSAQSNLSDGQVITVSWSGFLPGQVVNVLQCTGDGTGGAESCDIAGGKILFPNPEGMGSLQLTIRIGPIGNGVCDSANPCSVIVNDAGLTDAEATLRIPITLAD